MVKSKNIKKHTTVATEVLTYATKEEEEDFLGISEDEQVMSVDEGDTGPRRRAMEVDMSDDDMEAMDDQESMEGNDEEDGSFEEVDKAEEKVFDRQSSRELAKVYHEQNERTIFVGNITPKVTKKVLIQLFNSEKAAGPGAVESVRIRGAIPKDETNNRHAKRRAVIQQKFKDEDNQTLCAFVVLKKKELVEKCLNLNNHTVDGRHIRVDVVTGKKMSYDSTNCIFVGNLPFDCNEEQIREAFSKCGDVKSVRLVRSKEDGKTKGFGYVSFVESMGVDFSLKLNSTMEINGRKIRIEKWSGKETQKHKRKTNDKVKKVPIKKRKVIIPTNMHSLELSEYIKSKQHKLNKKTEKKKSFIKTKKSKPQK